MENKTGAYLVAIVALVAVVGLVLMFTGSDSESAYVVDEDGNIAGEAFRFGKVNTQLSTTVLNVQSLQDRGVTSVHFGSDSASGCMSECRRNCEGTCEDHDESCLCVTRD